MLLLSSYIIGIMLVWNIDPITRGLKHFFYSFRHRIGSQSLEY